MQADNANAALTTLAKRRQLHCSWRHHQTSSPISFSPPTHVGGNNLIERKVSAWRPTREQLRIDLVSNVGTATGVGVVSAATCPIIGAHHLDRLPRPISNAGGRRGEKGGSWGLSLSFTASVFVLIASTTQTASFEIIPTILLQLYSHGDSSPLRGRLPRIPLWKGIFPGPRDPVIPCVASIPNHAHDTTIHYRIWDMGRKARL